MGESGGFNGDIDLPGGSFSRLLLSADDIQRSNSSFHVFSHAQPSSLFSNNTPKMLCFGDFSSEISQISSSFSSFTDTSSASSCGNPITTLNNKRRSGSGHESRLVSGNVQKNGRKKNKPELEPTTITTSLVGHAKGKREKLGERITALQQLVCPYGKTDTASVLHEAMGYIRFLQDQVKVLSSPYLQSLPSSSSPQHTLSVNENIPPRCAKTYDLTSKCLRSRGLCLIPVECIIGVANSNGADFWSSATNLSTPSTVFASRNSS